MHICIAAGIYPPDVGGPATYITQLVPILQRNGHTVRVVTYSDVATDVQDDTCGYNVIRVIRQSTFGNYIRYTLQLSKASRGADLIYAFDHMSAGIPAAFVSKLRRIPLYVRVGGDFLWERYVRMNNAQVTLRQYYAEGLFKRDTIRFALIRRVFAQARRVIFTTAFQKELFQSPYHLPNDRLSVVQNAMPLKTSGMQHVRERKEYLFAGRTLAIRTLEQLIDAFVGANISEYTLSIITEAPEASRLRTYCQVNGYDSQSINIENQLSHAALLERIRTCHAMIFPRLTDISPNTLFEALSMGVPCLCTSEIGLDVVSRLQTFDPVSKEALTVAVQRLAKDDEYEAYRAHIGTIVLDRTYDDIAKETLAQFEADRNRILVLGNDPEIFNTESGVYGRSRIYAGMFSKYVVLSPGKMNATAQQDGTLSVMPAYGRSKAGQFLSLWQQSRTCIRREHLRLITSQDPFLFGLLAYGLSKLHRIPFHVQEHGDFFSDPYWRQESFRHRLEYILGRWIIQRADGIRVVSERSKRTLIERLDVATEKVTFVPVYTPPMDPCEEVDRKNNVFRFLSIGRFEKQKNLPLLIKAFALVYEAHPHARLVLYGKGSELSTIEAEIDRWGVRDAVQIHAWTNDIRSVYCSSDCYVLTSDYEGWGRVIIEAAHCGLPVVMTDVGCAGDVINDGVSGRVVGIRDVDAVASAMLDMMNNRDKRNMFVRAAKESVLRLPNQEETLRLYAQSWYTAQ
jgi:glycosyltransferase involved in cell wall biosynthesis